MALRIGFWALVMCVGIWGTGDEGNEFKMLAQNGAALMVKSSQQALHVSTAEIPARVAKALEDMDFREMTEAPLISDTYVRVYKRGTWKEWPMDHRGVLYDENTKTHWTPPEGVRQKLVKLRLELRQQHYGRLLHWERAKELIPLKSVLTVQDVETGLRFQVQRRAGRNHADVQPLTKSDTEMMKRVYEGTWSWKRRAIVVERDGKRLAASMHGMPHGGDGIPDNGFSGHFCIHFLGSKTHSSGSLDMAHQAMVYKAAGRIDRFISRLGPEEVVELFFVAMNQQDRNLLERVMGRQPVDRREALFREAALVNGFRPMTDFPKLEPGGATILEYRVTALVYRQGVGKPEKRHYRFILRKNFLNRAWKIEEMDYVSGVNAPKSLK